MSGRHGRVDAVHAVEAKSIVQGQRRSKHLQTFINKIACKNITKMADWRFAPGRFLFRLYSLRAGFSVCSSLEISFGSNFLFFWCLASFCPANRSTGARVEIGLIKAAKFCSISWTLRP